LDPTQCYLEMFEAMRDGNQVTARQRALALKQWLDSGGFYPPRYTKTEVDGYLRNVLWRTAHLGNDV